MCKKLRSLWLLALGVMPLVTTATCDPISGSLDFFRDDNYYDYYYEDVYVVDGYYDDCYFFCY